MSEENERIKKKIEDVRRSRSLSRKALDDEAALLRLAENGLRAFPEYTVLFLGRKAAHLCRHKEHHVLSDATDFIIKQLEEGL